MFQSNIITWLIFSRILLVYWCKSCNLIGLAIALSAISVQWLGVIYEKRFFHFAKVLEEILKQTDN